MTEAMIEAESERWGKVLRRDRFERTGRSQCFDPEMPLTEQELLDGRAIATAMHRAAQDDDALGDGRDFGVTGEWWGKDDDAELVERLAYAVANAKLGEGPSVRCEGPTEFEIGEARKWVRRVLAARIEALSCSSVPLVEALDNLQQAEAEYRLMHDRHGDGSQAAGRAWDLMRRAGDKARAALSSIASAGGTIK